MKTRTKEVKVQDSNLVVYQWFSTFGGWQPTKWNETHTVLKYYYKTGFSDPKVRVVVTYMLRPTGLT